MLRNICPRELVTGRQAGLKGEGEWSGGHNAEASHAEREHVPQPGSLRREMVCWAA